MLTPFNRKLCADLDSVNQAIFSSGVIDNVSNLWWVFLLSVALSTASAFALWFVYMRYRSLKEDLTFLVSEKKK